MLNENIKAIRKSKGISQEELALKLNVVRQTISKWEQGLSVPDSDLLIALSKALETPVSTLMGEIAQQKEQRRKVLHWLFLLLCAGIAAVTMFLAAVNSPYFGWDYRDPELAVAGVAFHALEWFFIRLAPWVFTAAAAGAWMTRKK